jgi:hypothetical protein
MPSTPPRSKATTHRSRLIAMPKSPGPTPTKQPPVRSSAPPAPKIARARAVLRGAARTTRRTGPLLADDEDDEDDAADA